MMLRLFTVVWLAVGSIVTAGETDWPQWRGPNRDGHAAPQRLLQSWPEGGPKLLWTFDAAGTGYSSCSIVDGRLYTQGSDGGRCYAMCLEAETGRELWRQDYGRTGTQDDYNQGWGGGPRSTPTVDGDTIALMSDVGVLAVLDRDTGRIRWRYDFVEKYGSETPYWGFSESPLIDGDRVVATAGGDPFLVGFDRDTGRQVFASEGVEAPPQYVSIIRGEIDRVPFYVTASKPGLFAFAADGGSRLFSDTATGNKVAVIPTPVITGDRLYHTSDYGAGNTLLQLSPTAGGVRANSVYHRTDKTMRNHHGGVVVVDGTVFGYSKVNGNVWMAQDLESGDVLWEHRIRPNKSGSIAFGDGRLYGYTDKDATVRLFEPSRTGWTPRGELVLPRQTSAERDRGAIWSHPVIADGKLFVRDQELIFAYDIRR